MSVSYTHLDVYKRQACEPSEEVQEAGFSSEGLRKVILKQFFIYLFENSSGSDDSDTKKNSE